MQDIKLKQQPISHPDKQRKEESVLHLTQVVVVSDPIVTSFVSEFEQR